MTDELIKGFEDFRHYQYEDGTSLMPKLVEEGQSPRHFIISCIDSRSNPGVIFRAQPGSFFAHKAMGAIVRPYKKGTALAAALQFALKYNNVDTIIVLGHTQCGAIRALAENLDDEEIAEFISVAKSSLSKAQKCCKGHDNVLAQTEQEIVLESAKNLTTYPSVQDALEKNQVTIKPWLFDMKAGNLLEYNPQEEIFTMINQNKNTKDTRQNA